MPNVVRAGSAAARFLRREVDRPSATTKRRLLLPDLKRPRSSLTRRKTSENRIIWQHVTLFAADGWDHRAGCACRFWILRDHTLSEE